MNFNIKNHFFTRIIENIYSTKNDTIFITFKKDSFFNHEHIEISKEEFLVFLPNLLELFPEPPESLMEYMKDWI